MYTVKQTAALTGVAEATLRVWERRYSVVRPTRTPGGYRLYDDGQLARLREMAALVAEGVPASRAAEAVLAMPEPQPPQALADAPGDDELLEAAASLDPARLDAVITRALASGPFEQVADEWLVPQLGRLGGAWEAGRLTVAQEHFASNGLMRALAAVFDEAGAGVHGPTVLVGLPAGDRHELALFAFAACLRRLGVDVIYLGADVPAADWEQSAARLRARAAVIGVTSERSVAEARDVAQRLAEVTPPLTLWVGGSHRADLPGTHQLPDAVADAAALLQRSLAAGT